MLRSRRVASIECYAWSQAFVDEAVRLDPEFPSKLERAVADPDDAEAEKFWEDVSQKVFDYEDTYKSPGRSQE